MFDLAHDDIAGLVGMSFLRRFNFEVRPGEKMISLESLDPAS